MNHCDVPDTFLMPCFLLVVTSFFHSFPVFLNFFFCHANIRVSRRLFYVCVGLIFFESQNKQHAYLLHVQKMQNVCFNLPILKHITECDFEKFCIFLIP